MNLRPMIIVNGLLVAGMAAASAWALQVIPDGTRIPVHFDLQGNADRFTDKVEFLLLMPLIAAGLTGMLWIIPRFDPRRANIEASAKFWNAAAILSCGLLAYVHVILVANAAGYRVDIMSALVPALSVLFMGLGNYLGKTRSNWFGGVRTPWSMSSEYSWERTHRWSGRMMVASGIAALVAWFFVEAKIAIMILIGLVIATSAVSIVLSYLFWRADPDRTAHRTN
jgi:uncharacterized membrane protein